MGNSKFLLRTYCATFNHENYILDALKGFAMQQTNFPVVFTIVDDASTDGTAAVIKKFVSENFSLDADSVGYEKDLDYGHVTFAQHKTNKNCYFAVVYLKENHYSQKKSKEPYLTEWMDTKYIALCEGDDYWTDPLKLQKQVDFLEGHEEYVVCSHNFIKYYENTKTFENHSWYHGCFREPESCFLSYTLDEYFMRWWTQPLTCMYRNGEYLQNIPRKKYKYFRDDIFYYYVLKEGKGALFSEVMGVYRIHDGGVWQGKDFIKQHKAGRDNALAIYMNENDKRALCRATRDEMAIIVDGLWDRHCRWEALMEIKSYRKKVPVSEYCRFLGSVREWFSGKIKRKTKVVFKVLSGFVFMIKIIMSV